VLKIQHVTDDANYLASIGRERIAHVVRDAEIAESNARNEAAKEAAAAEMRAKVAEADAERAVVQKRNEFRRVKAELESEAEVRRGARRAGRPGRARHRRAGAAGGAPGAGDGAPAGGGGGAVGDQPRGGGAAGGGAAAPIAEDGRASAMSLRLVADAWKAAGTVGAGHVPHQQARGDHAHRRRQRRPDPARPGAAGRRGDGQTFPRFAAAYPQAVATVLRALAETTGVDVTSLLAPVPKAGGSATAPGAALPTPGGLR
jgi:flotillin